MRKPSLHIAQLGAIINACCKFGTMSKGYKIFGRPTLRIINDLLKSTLRFATTQVSSECMFYTLSSPLIFRRVKVLNYEQL